MFLNKKTVLEIWLNPGLNFRGTEINVVNINNASPLNSINPFTPSRIMMLCNFSCEQNSIIYSHCNEAFQVITIQTAADPGEGPRGARPSPLVLDYTEA